MTALCSVYETMSLVDKRIVSGSCGLLSLILCDRVRLRNGWNEAGQSAKVQDLNASLSYLNGGYTEGARSFSRS